MDFANVDSNDLLRTLENLRTSISSIQATRSSLMKKHQDLGAGWNDRQYNELGNIIKECEVALNDILKILNKGEKYIGALAKSLAEYENVNMGNGHSGSNPFIQNLRSSVPSDAGKSKYQYCLGVLTRGEIPAGYTEMLSKRHDSAEKNVQCVFDHFTNKMLIQNANYSPTRTAHYTPINYVGQRRGVYYNASSDMNNRRGNGTTYYHELAHMIDHAATGFSGNISNTPEFEQALRSDGQRILNIYNNATEEEQLRFINSLRRNDRTHSFQDLMDATTNGAINVGWSHTPEYWQRPGNLQAEAFAHFFEASMGARDKLNVFERYFPTAFRIFTTMIENMLPAGDDPELERSR